MSASEPETTDQLDHRPVILAVTAWAAMWVVTSGNRAWWGLVGLVAVTLLSIGWLRQHWLGKAVGLLLVACVVAGGLRVAQIEHNPIRELAEQRAVVAVELQLTGSPRLREGSGPRPSWWMSRAIVSHIQGRGEAWASGLLVEVSATGQTAHKWADLAPGTTVHAVVQLNLPDESSDVVAVARARDSPTMVAEPTSLDAAVARVRVGLREASAPLADDPRALIPALVVGDTSGMSTELTEQFKTTGLTHLVAVSGSNLTLLLVFVRTCAVWIGVRGRWLTVVLVVTVAVFVVLCLGEPSVVRAAGMGLIGLLAVGRAGRGRHGLRFLGVAIVVLVGIDPWLSRSWGFVLSVAATTGLLWWASRWTTALATWLPRWLAESVAVPLAAQTATLPLVVALSGQISVVGLLANVIASPLVGPATVLGFIAAGLSVVWLPAATGFAWLAGWCAQALCWIARLGQAMPGATRMWPATPSGLVLIALSCWLVGMLTEQVLRRRWLSLGLALALVVTLIQVPTTPGWPPQRWSMVACDVGQGDAWVFRAGVQQAVVVDGGPDPSLLERCLAHLAIKQVPLVVVTHLHADHVTGLTAVADKSPEFVVHGGGSSRYGEAILASLPGQRQRPRPGETWQFGAVQVQVLAAPESTAPLSTTTPRAESSEENDASLLLRITVDGLSVLIAGDVGEQGQRRYLGLGAALDVDVLAVPHHGSSDQSTEFLAATTPKVALISVGATNDYGHPTAKTLRRVENLGAQVFRTDQHGAIALSQSGTGWEVTTQR